MTGAPREQHAIHPCSRCGNRPVVNLHPKADLVLCQECAWTEGVDAVRRETPPQRDETPRPDLQVGQTVTITGTVRSVTSITPYGHLRVTLDIDDLDPASRHQVFGRHDEVFTAAVMQAVPCVWTLNLSTSTHQQAGGPASDQERPGSHNHQKGKS